MSFDLVIAADWSSAASPTRATPQADAIWVCARLHGVDHLEYFRTRHAALDWIGDWLGQGHRTLLGFDFAFGWPRGVAQAVAGRAEALAMWDWLAARVEDGPDNANNRFAVAGQMNAAFPGTGPLWGCPPGQSVRDLPAKASARSGHGVAEHRRCEASNSAKSVLQVAYAGSVGGQSLVGQAALARLRAAHPDMAVWPMQSGFALPDARIVLAEIYPSLFPPAPHAIKDAGQVLASAAALAAAPADWFSAPTDLPEAARIAAEEGWILGVGPDGPLPLGGDCAALPAGVVWTPVETALQTLSRLSPIEDVETVPIQRAAGRILAEDLSAKRANPPQPNAAVDGWGYAHNTLGPGPLPVEPGRAAAGEPFAGTVRPGHALRILTGAALPAGVDTVALQEDVTEREGQIHLRHHPTRGANTRPAGEDVALGAPVLAQGARLRPTDIAFAIAAGHGALPVYRRLRVAVLSTGTELIPPGAEGPGIHDANRPMLLSMLENWGFEPVDLGHVPDDPEGLVAALDRAAEADAVLTSGGASAGDEDHLSRLVRAHGRVDHWRIAIKPGRPLLIGAWGAARTPLFGLPGNPVAAFTCAALFARPALQRLAGAPWQVPDGILVPAAFAKRKKAGRREILRARLNAEGAAEVFASEGSGRVSGLSWARGFVDLPDAACVIEPGDPVRFIPFSALDLG